MHSWRPNPAYLLLQAFLSHNLKLLGGEATFPSPSPANPIRAGLRAFILGTPESIIIRNSSKCPSFHSGEHPSLLVSLARLLVRVRICIPLANGSPYENKGVPAGFLRGTKQSVSHGYRKG